MQNEYTITLYQNSDGEFSYDVYTGIPDMSISLYSEDATLGNVDGGVCTGKLKDVFGMIGDVILKNENLCK